MLHCVNQQRSMLQQQAEPPRGWCLAYVGKQPIIAEPVYPLQRGRFNRLLG